MPNAKVLEQKKAVVSGLAESMKKAQAGVLVDYKGINVADDTKLRQTLRAAGVDMSSPAPVQAACAVFRRLVDELDSIIGTGL